jgi:hypothetical protein
MATDLHEDLRQLSFLLGTWRGEGAGVWPESDPFTYGEEVVYEHVGDAFLLYSQRSWSLSDEEPIHFERGFLRPAGLGRVDLVLAHPIGVAEVAEGTVSGGVVEVASTSVALATAASPVTELRRRIEATGDAMTYELSMATREVPLAFHVRSRLIRS